MSDRKQIIDDLGRKVSHDVCSTAMLSLQLCDDAKERFIVCNFALCGVFGFALTAAEQAGFTREAAMAVMIANLGKLQADINTSSPSSSSPSPHHLAKGGAR